MKSLQFKGVMGAFLFVLVLSGGMVPARAAEEAPPALTTTIQTDVLSQYIFRGLANSKDGAVIQPSMTLGYQGVSLNIWGNFDTHEVTPNKDRMKWNETDITLSYTRELFTNFSATVGAVHYFLQNGVYGDSSEFFFGGAYTLPWFTVTLTTYKEFENYPGWYIQLDFAKSIPLGYYDMSLELDANFSYNVLTSDDNLVNLNPVTVGDYSDFHAGQVSAALRIPLGKYFSVAPKIGLAFPLSNAASKYLEANSFDGQDVHVFGGMNLTLAF